MANSELIMLLVGAGLSPDAACDCAVAIEAQFDVKCRGRVRNLHRALEITPRGHAYLEQHRGK